MNDFEDIFLPINVQFKAGDKAVLAPIYVMPANIMERGLLSRAKFSKRTLLVDACTGRTETAGEYVPLSNSADLPAESRRLPRRLTLDEAAAIAEDAARPASAKGWRRGLHSVTVFFIENNFKTAWRVYIVRGETLIDAFSGKKSDAAQILGLVL